MNENNVLHLVYFNCRGAAQYLRYIAYEIGVPLQEIHIGNDGKIPQHIQHLDISVTDLPCLIYKGRVFKEPYPTIRFLCQHFNRPDLLGSNLQEQTKISQIYCKTSKKKGRSSFILSKFLPKMVKEPNNVKKLKEEMLKQYEEINTYFSACETLYAETGNFLFDHITIVDFIFYEHCFYITSMFGDILKKSVNVAFPFRNFFERTNFYKTHGNKLENFPIFFPDLDPIVNEGIKLMMGHKSA